MSGQIDFQLITDIKDKFLLIGAESVSGESWALNHQLQDGPTWAPAHVVVTNGELNIDVCEIISYKGGPGSNMCSYQKVSGHVCYTAEEDGTRVYCLRAHPSSIYHGSWCVGQQLSGGAGSFTFDDGIGAIFVLEGDVTIDGIAYSAGADLSSYHLIEFGQGSTANYSGTGTIAVLWKHPEGVDIDAYEHPLVTPLLRGDPYVA